MNVDHVGTALLLTLLAGLSTGIGSTVAFFARRTNPRFLAAALGFSAGVMLYLAFAEILVAAGAALARAAGDDAGAWHTAAAFFGGVAVIALIDRFVPAMANPHELRVVEEMQRPAPEPDPELRRLGTMVALVVAIHNVPEGLATFTSALHDPTLGVSTALAIAIHNIPEGIAISVPVFFVTGSRRKAFAYSFLSGLSETAGALFGLAFLSVFSSGYVFGMLLAMAAGIMVYIAVDQLLPVAHRYGEHHVAIYGFIAGMAVVALSLLLVR